MAYVGLADLDLTRCLEDAAQASEAVAQAVRAGQCYQMERVLSCLDLGTIASEDLCSEGEHSSGRLSEAS